jgi:hypothetical protein
MKRKQYVPDGTVDLDKVVVTDKKGRRIDREYVDRVVKSADAVRPVVLPGLSERPGPSPR